MRLDALTGLRFVVAIWVVLFHYARPVLQSSPDGVRNIVAVGEAGPSIFFVLSGFVLAYTYLDPARRPLAAFTFWRARVARVYPAFALSIVLAVGLSWLNANRADLWQLVPVLVLGQAWGDHPLAWNGPAWSLSVEAAFYALFPLLGPALARLRSRGLLLMAVQVWMAGTCLVIVAAPFGPQVWPGWSLWWPPFHLAAFVLGTCVGLLYLRCAPVLRARLGLSLSVSASLALVLVLSASARPPVVLLDDGMLSPIVAALLFGLASGRGPVSWLLSRRPIVLLGEASYALYILQEPLSVAWLSAARALTGSTEVRSNAVAVAAFVAILVAVSITTYWFVERPCRRAILAWTPTLFVHWRLARHTGWTMGAE
jgi:peptidoglycan/LPS O-acetylase OafA/YrhL